MAILNIDAGSASGNFRPILKPNIKAGRVYIRENGDDVELDDPVMMMDLHNIVSGWAAFREMQAPERVFDPSQGVRAAKTSEDQKRCVMVLCYATESFYAVAELCTTAMHMTNALKDLFAEFSEAPESKEGLLPVVQWSGWDKQDGKYGTNYRPILKIVYWGERPQELPDEHPAKDELGSGANDNEAPAAHVAAPAVANGSARPVF